MKKYLTLFLFSFLFITCNDNNDNVDVYDITGTWECESVLTDIVVNDNEAKDIILEDMANFSVRWSFTDEGVIKLLNEENKVTRAGIFRIEDDKMYINLPDRNCKFGVVFLPIGMTLDGNETNYYQEFIRDKIPNKNIKIDKANVTYMFSKVSDDFYQ